MPPPPLPLAVKPAYAAPPGLPPVKAHVRSRSATCRQRGGQRRTWVSERTNELDSERISER
eukprot:1818273-Prymnesium_polylepis.1